jgi:hypothetical protein
MKLARVEKIAHAILHEGYLLDPCRGDSCGWLRGRTWHGRG